MIAMQSGFVLADIHNLASNSSQEQHIIYELGDEQHDNAHEECCAFCVHSHCAHFIAINDAKDINIYPIPDHFTSLLPLTSLAGHSTSMFRPPKS
jgi:hypothetical protein